MARPRKQGLDYFPHDTNPDKKLERFYVLFEAKGRSFWFAMLEEIYREGWFIDISDAETRLILSRKCFCTLPEWENMLARALKEDLFDKDEHEKRKILTSNGIKKRYETVTKKRVKSNENKVSAAETTESEIVTADLTALSGEFRLRAKLNERKEKKIIPPKGGGGEMALPPTEEEVESIFAAFPKIRRGKDAKNKAVRIPNDARAKIRTFLIFRPDYPLLEAVKLLDASNEYPPDMEDFLEKPWDIDALRATRRKPAGSGGINPDLVRGKEIQDREAAEWDALPPEEKKRRLEAAQTLADNILGRKAG